MRNMSEQIMDNQATDAAVENQEPAAKTYTQEEFDNHMAGLKASLSKRFEKQISELGDLDELKQLKANAEQQKHEEAIKRGEFEKILQEKIAAKDAEIAERNKIIEEYTVNAPLLNAAAKYKAVNPEQVVQLVRTNVRLGDTGSAEIVDTNGMVRYDDAGKPISVDDYIQDFLKTNPHFVAASASTTNTKSSATPGVSLDNFDLENLDLTRPQDREIYRKAKAKGII